jgi:hypothetical protein
MVATHDNRQSVARDNPTNGVIDVLQTDIRTHVDHIHVAAIDDTHTVQELSVELVIVITHAPKRV